MTSWRRHMVKKFAQNFCKSKLNLLVKFYENGSQALILLKREMDSEFSIFWPRFCICTESPDRHNSYTYKYILTLKEKSYSLSSEKMFRRP